jgi:phage repressor protein C with HTH and peptisase S24 domain
MDGLERDTELICAIIEFAGVSAAEVARKAKVDAETVRRPATGKATTRISQRTLEKLRDAYPTFPGWSAETEWEVLPNKADSSNGDMVELEQIDLRYGLGASYADGPVGVERRAFSREWLRSITSTPPRNLFWAIGDGDSMEPTIRSGEIILIDRTEGRQYLDDGIWALTHGEVGMIKRLRRLPDGTVELHSDNHLVRPYVATKDELNIVGRVVAVVRTL